MLSTGTDPFTQCFQAVRNALTTYPPLTPGTGAFRTFQDMSDPNFQQLLENYQAGDTPSLLLWQRNLKVAPFGSNSMTCDFSMNVVICVTSDTLQIATINQIVYLIFLAMVQQPLNLGLPFIRKWWLNQGDAVIVNPQDKAGGGSQRWSYAATVSLDAYLIASQLQGLQPIVE